MCVKNSSTASTYQFMGQSCMLLRRRWWILCTLTSSKEPLFSVFELEISCWLSIQYPYFNSYPYRCSIYLEVSLNLDIYGLPLLLLLVLVTYGNAYMASVDSANYVYHLVLIQFQLATTVFLDYNFFVFSFKFRLSEGIMLLILQLPM